MWKLLRRWKALLPLLVALLLALAVLRAPRGASGSECCASWLTKVGLEAPARAARALRDLGARLKSMWRAEERARALEQELALLRLEYRQLEETYQRSLLRGRSLQTGRRWLTRLIPANLLARDPSTWFQVVLLDKGREDGVQPGQGVVSPLGVVGKVLRVQERSCKVVFLTDASFRAAVRLARSRVLAILVGDGRKGCRLEYLSGKDDVQVGDLVETAPGSLHFPSGIPAGTVVRVTKIDDGLRLAVDVKPAAEFSRLDSLYIAAREQP